MKFIIEFNIFFNEQYAKMQKTGKIVLIDNVINVLLQHHKP